MTKFPLITLALILAVVTLGLFVAVTDAPAYAGTASETCNNCHVMDPMYENYYHAAHKNWAKCADCHLPHENIFAYYFEKARQGAHDVYVFTTGQTPEVIRASKHSKAIIQSNCLRCHEQTVESVVMGAQPYDRYCWDCHRNVAHGPRGLSNTPYQDAILYPIK
jgi:cytochrome c nitrite reductase small subunit